MDAESKLREEVRERMAAYEADSDSEVTGRIVRKAVVGIFLCLAAVALFQQVGGDKKSASSAVERPRRANAAIAPRRANAAIAPRRANAAIAPAGDDRWNDVSDQTREMVIRSGAGGHFILDASVNGNELPFVVDTGATSVFMSADTARAAGIDPDTLDYSVHMRTASGVIRGARVTLREVRIGQLAIRDVEATVARTDLPVSLLGMTFLNRLQSYEVRNGKLVMRW
jgi:aspartyl protease family protein